MDTFMDKLAQKLTAQEMIKANMAADAEEMSRLKSKTREYDECLEQMQKLVEESIAKINEIQQNSEVQMSAELQGALEDIKKQFGDKLDSANDNVHKECVKVYRNVQAVVVEETGKQTENISNVVNALRGKLNAILSVSIVALILALGSIAMQILNMMNYKFF